MREDAPQREHSLREVFNGLRYAVRAGEAWRMMPNDLPPRDVVYGQTRRWIAAGVFGAMTQDLRRVLRVLSGRGEEPTAAVFDSRTLQSTPESGGRAGYDGAKRRKGSKTHAAVDTLGHLLALRVTAADEQDRRQVKKLAEDVQAATGDSVELAFVDQGYTGEQPAGDAKGQGIELSVVKLPEANAGSCCCRGGGSWNARSRGPPASGGWRATTSDSPPPPPDCTSSPSPASGCAAWRHGIPKVHTTPSRTDCPGRRRRTTTSYGCWRDWVCVYLPKLSKYCLKPLVAEVSLPPLLGWRK